MLTQGNFLNFCNYHNLAVFPIFTLMLGIIYIISIKKGLVLKKKVVKITVRVDLRGNPGKVNNELNILL